MKTKLRKGRAINANHPNEDWEPKVAVLAGVAIALGILVHRAFILAAIAIPVAASLPSAIRFVRKHAAPELAHRH